jgi:hypothetical protein
MPAKKTAKQSGRKVKRVNEGKASRANGSKGTGVTRAHGNGEGNLPDVEFDFSDYPHQVYPNPETPEEREKRLSSRKALTLRAFRATYENRHRKTF